MNTIDQQEYLEVFLNDVFKRDSHDPSDESVIAGCKTCENKVPKCHCAANQECQQIARTCKKCSYVRCVGGPSKNKGGIIGGIIGSIALLSIVVIFIIYSRKKHRRSNRVARIEAEEKKTLVENEKEVLDYGVNESNVDLEKGEFKPPSILKSSKSSIRSSTLSEKITSNRSSGYTMTSLASSAFTRASNIIPIAYIPGRKIQRPKTTFGSPLSTQTAIRATPRLVPAKKSALKNSSSESSDSDSSISFDKHSLKSMTKKELKRKTNRKTGLTHIMEEEDIDDLISLETDTDVDGSNSVGSRKRMSQLSLSSTVNRPSTQIISDLNEDPVNPFDDINEIGH